MKTETNKQTEAFNMNYMSNLSEELKKYINKHLYDNNITIQYFDKIFVFDWNFEPQKTGTQYQRNTYKRITIQNKTEQIIKLILTK